MLIYDPMKIFFEQSPIIDNKYFPKLSATLLIQDASTIIYKKSYNKGKHSKKCTFYTLRFGCSFAAVNTIKPQLL